MPRIPNKERRRLKKEAILESARIVFCHKGFIGVTMKDIIEECSISRGGIYLYYESVDDLFVALVKNRTKRKFEGIREQINADMPFFDLLDSYFAGQKDRLLHMEGSMLRATYEYFFTHKSPKDREFQQSQLNHVQKTIIEILQLGAKQGVLLDEGLPALAEHFMFIIEGLSVLALLGGITEAHIDRQLALMKSMLPINTTEHSKPERL